MLGLNPKFCRFNSYLRYNERESLNKTSPLKGGHKEEKAATLEWRLVLKTRCSLLEIRAGGRVLFLPQVVYLHNERANIRVKVSGQD